MTAGNAYLDEAEGRIRLARGDAAGALPFLESIADEATREGFRLVALRARTLAAVALARSGRTDEATRTFEEILTAAAAAGAELIRADAERAAAEVGGLDLGPSEPSAAMSEPALVSAGERLVTSLFADVRGYSGIAAATPPAELVDRLGALHRWASAEVQRHHGIVDKFAGDAVMATFNASGSRLDHTQHALEAALALSGKASLLDLGVGIGIAVGPAVVGRVADGANVSVLGMTTNLAARLQAAAQRGEVVLSDEAYRRVAEWLGARGLTAVREQLDLKGFADAQPAWRLSAG